MLIKKVYHGSCCKRIKSNPSRHTRTRVRGGVRSIIFEGESFHASVKYWIALAYTYRRVSFTYGDREIYYNVEIDLYTDRHKLIIHGINSLEESLNALYGEGGYISSFSSHEFFYVKGLGNLEVITNKVLDAVSVERISNPIIEMRNLGVSFQFIDLSEKRNEKRRNYKD